MKVSCKHYILAIVGLAVTGVLFLAKYIFPHNSFVLKWLNDWPQFFLIIGFVLIVYFFERKIIIKKTDRNQ